MKQRYAVGMLAAALWLGAAQAQQPLSLQQGFEAAWALTPEARAAALWRDAAAAAQQAAERLTQGPATLEVTARTDRTGRNEGSREYEAALAVPLWLAGERRGTRALAQAEGQALDARTQAARWRLAAQVRDAYWAWQLAHLGHELAQQRLDNARQLADDVQRRWHAGDMARADSHQARGAVADAQAQLAQAEAELAQAAHEWMALTGAQQPPLAVQAGTAGESFGDSAGDSSEQSASGEQAPQPAALPDTHPALRELAALGEVAQHQLALARVQTRPNPEVVLGSTRERDMRGARYAPSVFAGVRVALGHLPDSAARRISASAELLQAQARLAQEEAALRGRAQAAALQLQALRRAQAAAGQRAALARAVRGFIQKSFALGESDLPTRLRVEQEAFEAEREAARARVQVQAAASQLQHALGLLPE